MFVIELTYTSDLAAIDAAMKAHVAFDPFCARGLAEVRIVEFRASQHANDMPNESCKRRRPVVTAMV